MIKLILFTSISLSVSLSHGQSLQCRDLFPQAQLSGHVKAEGKEQVTDVVNRLMLNKQMGQLNKYLKAMKHRFLDPYKSQKDPLSKTEMQEFIHIFERNYDSLSLRELVIFLEVVQLGRFPFDNQQVQTWSDVYVKLINNSETTLSTKNLATPLQSLALMRKTIPDNALLAVQSKVLEQGYNMQFSIKDLSILTRIFSMEQHILKSQALANIFDFAGSKVFENSIGQSHYSQTPLDSYATLGFLRGLYHMRHTPSLELSQQWHQLRNLLENAVVLSGQPRMEKMFNEVKIFFKGDTITPMVIEESNNGKDDVFFFEGLNDY